MMFEMATGDFLFEPRGGQNFTKDDDHLAQIIELLGPIPKHLQIGGKHQKRFFCKDGTLRKIKQFTFWPLLCVLCEKYRYKEEEAKIFASFLLPMLEYDINIRVTAKSMLEHEWLKMPNNYDTKMNEQEYEFFAKSQKQAKMTNADFQKDSEASIEDNDIQASNESEPENAEKEVAEEIEDLILGGEIDMQNLILA